MRGSRWTDSKVLVTVVCLLAAALVAACGGGDDGGDSAGAESADEKVTLEVWDYYGAPESDNKAMNDLYAAFEAENPNITVKRTTLGYPDMRQKLIQAIATKRMPDIAIIDNSDLPVFASQEGVLADLTAKFDAWEDTDQYFPSVLQKYDGKNWHMPFRANTLALFYNKDLLEEAGFDAPPTTWEELRTMAKALTKDQQYGFCFSAVATGEGDFQMLPFLWQAGGDVKTIGDEASVKALTFLNTLLNEDKSVPQGVLSWNQLDVGERFNAGTCAMMSNGPWQIQPADDAKVDYGVVPLPGDAQQATVLGGENMIVSADASVDAAWKLLTYLQREDVLTPEVVATLGILPLRNDQLEDDKFFQVPARKPFAEALKDARSRAFGPKFAEAQPLLWAMEQQVLTKEKTPQEAADEAAEGLKPLLGS